MPNKSFSTEQKRTLNRFTNSISKFANPVLIFVLLIMAIAPIMGVRNLSPITVLSKKAPTVLGVRYSPGEYGAELVSGSHRVIRLETLKGHVNDEYTYRATIYAHTAGEFSKPVLRFYNHTEETKTYRIVANEAPLDGVGLIFKEYNFELINQGELLIRNFKLEAGETEAVYLSVSSSENVNFRQKIDLSIYIVD